MKINEITDKFKVVRSTPQEVQLQSPANKTTITTTPSAFSQNLDNPSALTLNLGNTAPGQPQSPTQPAGQPQTQQSPTQPLGQQPAGQPQTQQSPTQPSGQPQTPQQAQSSDPAHGQTTAPGTTSAEGQPIIPQVGAEVELPDDIGSTMQSETFDVKDLVKNGNKPIGGRNGSDSTDDFIDDVTDDENHSSGRNKRTFVKPDPIRESEELIAMLTIAGLR